MARHTGTGKSWRVTKFGKFDLDAGYAMIAGIDAFRCFVSTGDLWLGEFPDENKKCRKQKTVRLCGIDSYSIDCPGLLTNGNE